MKYFVYVKILFIALIGAAVVIATSLMMSVASAISSLILYDFFFAHEIDYGKNWPSPRAVTALIAAAGGLITGIISTIKYCEKLTLKIKPWIE